MKCYKFKAIDTSKVKGYVYAENAEHARDKVACGDFEDSEAYEHCYYDVFELKETDEVWEEDR